MTTNKQNQSNSQSSKASPDQQRKSQRMEEGARTGKGDINKDTRNKNNPNQPR